MPKLYVCGEALIDFIPTRDDADWDGTYAPKPGGSPFNAAKAAAHAGADVSFLGGLSTDLFGEKLAADLDAYKVDHARVAKTDAPSTLAFVDNSSGDPRYAFFTTGSATVLMNPSPDLIDAQPGDILSVGSISLIEQPAADNIAAFATKMGAQMLVAFDPNARPSMTSDKADWAARVKRILQTTSIVKISAEDLEYLSPGTHAAQFAQECLESGSGLVVVTDGASGATAFSAGARQHLPTPKVDLKANNSNTVGAGDTFMGNMLAWILRTGIASCDGLRALSEDELSEMLQVATTAAALNCMQSGCMPPTLSETQDAINGDRVVG
jgi:fructokinase